MKAETGFMYAQHGHLSVNPSTSSSVAHQTSYLRKMSETFRKFNGFIATAVVRHQPVTFDVFLFFELSRGMATNFPHAKSFYVPWVKFAFFVHPLLESDLPTNPADIFENTSSLSVYFALVTVSILPSHFSVLLFFSPVRLYLMFSR